ncbi:UNVERIFIED_CONTAM: hypothetical protein Sradi_1758100 [Sesamum radiatum]|uniref:Uncharacterized protein n=1 Tax=Sesamum radiatum TaxID=300843 RepID=A0AAW2TUL6_SESRA
MSLKHSATLKLCRWLPGCPLPQLVEDPPLPLWHRCHHPPKKINPTLRQTSSSEDPAPRGHTPSENEALHPEGVPLRK